MATLNQIAFDIAMTLKRDTDYEFIEQLKFNIKTLRALFIRRDIASNGFSTQYLQSFIVDLKTVSLNEASDSCKTLPPLEGDCVILRSVDKLPELVRLKNHNDFKYVGYVDGLTSFSFVESVNVPLIKYRRYKKNLEAYDFVNNYLFLYNIKNIKFIKVKAVIVDPYLVNSCSSQNCVTDDTDFPIPTDLIFSIKEVLVKSQGILNDTSTKEISIDGTK